jgi:3-phenylpropionate/trans-cinnamate dioxygenase ferredoxin subunit
VSHWIDAVGTDELSDGGRRLVRCEGREIALFRVAGRHYAIDDRCPHAGSSLCGGLIEGASVRCRAHGLRFDLATGGLHGHPQFGVATFAVREHEGRIQIELGPDAA